MESHLINTTAFDQDLPAHFFEIPPHLFYFLIISPISLSLSPYTLTVPPTGIPRPSLPHSQPLIPPLKPLTVLLPSPLKTVYQSCQIWISPMKAEKCFCSTTSRRKKKKTLGSQKRYEREFREITIET